MTRPLPSPTRHECPAPECDAMVRNDYYACRRDWYRLPNRLRTMIYKTADWPFGDERADAEAACIEYYQAHPRSAS